MPLGTMPTDLLIRCGIVATKGPYAENGCIPRYRFQSEGAICLSKFAAFTFPASSAQSNVLHIAKTAGMGSTIPHLVAPSY